MKRAAAVAVAQPSLFGGAQREDDEMRSVWAGVSKSALQKHVRRGEVDRAVQAAHEMMRNSRTDFFSRWPIIVTEDVLTGVKLLPQLITNPLGVVAATAALPKNKDTWGLYIRMKADPISAEKLPSFERPLDTALEAGDALLASRVAWWLWEVGDKASVKRALGGQPGKVELFGRIDRMSNVCEVMFSLAGAVLWTMGQVAGSEVEVEVPDIAVADIEPMNKTVQWYACDGHTAPGRMALSALLKHHAPPHLSLEQLKETQFWLESARLGGAVAEHKFYSVDAALRRDGVMPDEGRELWLQLRPKAQELVVWACERFGITAVPDNE